MPGIPDDFAVEAQCLCQKDGIHPIRSKPLPRSILSYILRDRVAPVEMELEAYNKGSKELLLQVIMMDRFCTSREQASSFLDEILALPYHEEMRKHYK